MRPDVVITLATIVVGLSSLGRGYQMPQPGGGNEDHACHADDQVALAARERGERQSHHFRTHDIEPAGQGDRRCGSRVVNGKLHG